MYSSISSLIRRQTAIREISRSYCPMETQEYSTASDTAASPINLPSVRVIVQSLTSKIASANTMHKLSTVGFHGISSDVEAMTFTASTTNAALPISRMISLCFISYFPISFFFRSFSLS